MSEPQQADVLVVQAQGTCIACGQSKGFIARRSTPLAKAWYPHWFRDGLLCSACGTKPRHRAVMTAIERFYPGWRALRLHEGSPGGGISPRLRRECPGYVATQYHPQLGFGNVNAARGYRSEDLQAQTFPDESFDLVVTQDVFEHVFDPRRAFAEIARTLVPGGAHIFTVPLINRGKASQRRARLTETGVEHLLEPMYHGNPMSADGSLVTIDWGWDILDLIAEVTGHSTIVLDIDDMSQGISAIHAEVFITRKPGPLVEV